MQLENSNEVDTTVINAEQQDDQHDVTDNDDSLAAGFAKVRGGSAPIDANDSDATDTDTELDGGASDDSATDAEPAEEGTQQTAAEEVKHEPEDDIIPGLGMKASEVKQMLARVAEVDQLKASIEQANAKVYGKLGEYQRKINELANKPAGLALTKEKLTRLSAEFPDLAEMLAEDLSALQLASPASDFDPEKVNEIVQQRVGEALQAQQRETEKKLLTMAHRDWRDVIRSDDWKVWRGTLTADAQQILDSSWSAEQLSEQINTFKDWKKSTVEQAEATRQRRSNRLERSATPNGMPASAPTVISEEQALSAGFKKVRRAGY